MRRTKAASSEVLWSTRVFARGFVLTAGKGRVSIHPLMTLFRRPPGPSGFNFPNDSRSLAAYLTYLSDPSRWPAARNWTTLVRVCYNPVEEQESHGTVNGNRDR